MENLTKKQRREIYLKATELYNKENTDLSICRNICRLMKWEKPGRYDFDKLYKYLPEFVIFKPMGEECTESYISYGLWFDGMHERIICMLLCAEMCK